LTGHSKLRTMAMTAKPISLAVFFMGDLFLSSDALCGSVADKGYHSAATLTTLAECTPYRTYIPEPKLPQAKRHSWTDKPAEQRAAVYANRRRSRSVRGKRLQRQRSEQVERTFAHVCETGGARRTWLRGADAVQKRYLMAAAAHNLGRLMRELFGMGTPRGQRKAAEWLPAFLCTVQLAWLAVLRVLGFLTRTITTFWNLPIDERPTRHAIAAWRRTDRSGGSSTACYVGRTRRSAGHCVEENR